MQERFFIPQPTPVRPVCVETGPQSNNDTSFGMYTEANGSPLKWSGRYPLPDVGARINVHMNGIGAAIVHGYFESEGFLGVMAKATRPPAWLRKQLAKDKNNPDALPWRREGISCFFGTEIEPPARRARKVAQP
jgi:hypothetical protein